MRFLELNSCSKPRDTYAPSFGAFSFFPTEDPGAFHLELVEKSNWIAVIDKLKHLSRSQRVKFGRRTLGARVVVSKICGDCMENVRERSCSIPTALRLSNRAISYWALILFDVTEVSARSFGPGFQK